MQHDKAVARDLINAGHRAVLHGSPLRTLEAIFRHPTAANLEWMDVVELISRMGSITEQGSGEFDVHVDGKHHRMHKPHTKDLTEPEVIGLRHFLQQVQWQPETTFQADHHPDPAAPTLMVVMEQHGAKIYRLDADAGDVGQQVIRPYDPHSLLHDLARKVQSAQQDGHQPAEVAFYGRIADAVASGGRIIVVAHGVEQDPAARHLSELLRAQHGQSYQRVVTEAGTHLSGMGLPQLLKLAERAMAPAA